ncbi:Gla-3 [Aphelenchoides fujianensis]|nr:Gla-3 [Aphelenchoides fujianensis]
MAEIHRPVLSLGADPHGREQRALVGVNSTQQQQQQQQQMWKNPALYKSRMCDHFRTKGECKFGLKCWYAHGAHELRNVPRLDRNPELELSSLNEVIRALPPSSSRKAAEDKCQQLYHEILQYQLQPPPAPFGHHFHAPSAYAGAVHAIDASGRFVLLPYPEADGIYGPVYLDRDFLYTE